MLHSAFIGGGGAVYFFSEWVVPATEFGGTSGKPWKVSTRPVKRHVHGTKFYSRKHNPWVSFACGENPLWWYGSKEKGWGSFQRNAWRRAQTYSPSALGHCSFSVESPGEARKKTAQTVVIAGCRDVGLGIRIVGGRNIQLEDGEESDFGIFVKEIIPGRLADSDGQERERGGGRGTQFHACIRAVVIV